MNSLTKYQPSCKIHKEHQKGSTVLPLSNIPELIALEPQAHEVINQYYGGDVPIEILIRMPIVLNSICTLIFQYNRGDLNEVQLQQNIIASLDSSFQSSIKLNQSLAFRKKVKVVEGGKAESNLLSETAPKESHLQLLPKEDSVDSSNKVSWSNLIFDPTSILESAD